MAGGKREIGRRRGLEMEIFAVAACLLLLLLAVAPACLYVPCLPGRVVPALALVLVLVLLFLAWCCWLAWRWCCWSSASGLVTTFFKGGRIRHSQVHESRRELMNFAALLKSRGQQKRQNEERGRAATNEGTDKAAKTGWGLGMQIFAVAACLPLLLLRVCVPNFLCYWHWDLRWNWKWYWKLALGNCRFAAAPCAVACGAYAACGVCAACAACVACAAASAVCAAWLCPLLAAVS